MWASIRKSTIGLLLFALFTGGIIAVTQSATKNRIQTNEAAYVEQQLQSLVEGVEFDRPLLESAITVDRESLDYISLGIEGELTYYRLQHDGATVATILPVVAPDGYTEAIELLLAIDAKHRIRGIAITKHRETPGLGDQIEPSKSDWLEQFKGASLESARWKVKKDGGDFDALTGATISPRAVIAASERALVFFENSVQLLEEFNYDE